MKLDLKKINTELRDKDALDIVKWAVEVSEGRAICSTNFRPYEPVILHLVTSVQPEMPILWADSGCFLEETYLFAEKVVKRLSLNLKVYNPLMTEARRKAIFGAIPGVTQEKELSRFTDQVKIDPFKRGLGELAPKVWITAIRKDQTEVRQEMDIVSVTDSGVIKVAPLFYWSEAELESYTMEHELPNEKVYFDPTKVEEGRECGLHTEKL